MVVAASILGQGFHFGFSDTDAQWGKIHSLFFELNTYSINLSQNELQKYLVSKLVHKYDFSNNIPTSFTTDCTVWQLFRFKR